MEAIGQRQVARVLTAAQSANAVGDGGFYVTSALFFSHVVGLTPLQIGAGLTIAWGTGFALTTPLGMLADRVGLRRSGVILSLVTAAALVLVTLPRSMTAFVLVTSLYAVTQSASSAVRQALLVTLVEPRTRVMVRARLQAAINIGLGGGAALGGIALLVGTTTAYVGIFLFDALTFVTAGVLLTRLPQPRRPRSEPGRTAPDSTPRAGHSSPPASSRGVLHDRPYVAAAMLNAVLYLYMPMLSVVLPLYLVQRTDAPAWTIGGVFVLNTLGVALLQVRAATTVTDLSSAVVATRRAGVALLLACLAFALVASVRSPFAAVAVLAMAAGLQIVGEVLLASGSWEIGFGLADPHRQGRWQGLFVSGIALARALGPLALATLVLTWSGPGWLVLGVVFATAAAAMGPVVAWGERRRQHELDGADTHVLALAARGLPGSQGAAATSVDSTTL